jgi:hypothetical protein
MANILPTPEQEKEFWDAWNGFIQGKRRIRDVLDASHGYKYFINGEELKLLIPLSVLQPAVKEGAVILYDPTTERNPNYPIGNNDIRVNGFEYSPYVHKKGIWIQGFKHKAIVKFISFMHEQIKKKYDKDAYVQDSPEMREYETYIKTFINEDFIEAEYKTKTMTEIADIILFLWKIDTYYRARFKKFFYNFPRFSLTPDEEENIRKFH